MRKITLASRAGSSFAINPQGLACGVGMVEAKFEIACVIFDIRVRWFLLPTDLTVTFYDGSLDLRILWKVADQKKATAGFILGGAVFTQGMELF